MKARHLTPPDLRAVRLRVKARLTYRLTPVTGHTRLHALAPRRLGCRNVQCRMSRVLSLWPRVLFSWLSTTPHLSSVPVSTRPVYHHIRSGPRSTSRRPGAQEPSVNASSRPPRAGTRVSTRAGTQGLAALRGAAAAGGPVPPSAGGGAFRRADRTSRGPRGSTASIRRRLYENIQEKWRPVCTDFRNIEHRVWAFMRASFLLQAGRFPRTTNPIRLVAST